MKIILIATGHKIQCGTSSPRDSDRLCELAERIVLEAGCSLVAEEMSEDARDAEFGVGSTVPEKVAKKLGVKHFFVTQTQARDKVSALSRGTKFFWKPSSRMVIPMMTSKLKRW